MLIHQNIIAKAINFSRLFHAHCVITSTSKICLFHRPFLSSDEDQDVNVSGWLCIKRF